jgi:hypothetical protein
MSATSDPSRPPSEAGLPDLDTLSEAQLMALLAAAGHALPRAVIDACVGRGEAMVGVLRDYLEAPMHWSSEAAEESHWGRFHALQVLGQVPGQAAAEGLLAALGKMDAHPRDPLWDWLDGLWPAFFSNKAAIAAAPLRRLAETRGLDAYARAEAMACVAALAEQRGPAALDQALDGLARIAADPGEDMEAREGAAQVLLDLPRERHRGVLEALAEALEAGGDDFVAFDGGDIDWAYQVGVPPAWRRVGDPLAFYDPDCIAEREARWATGLCEEEARCRRRAAEALRQFAAAQRREKPGVGRDDPCPCGSGKRYAECCMGRDGAPR